jgi:ketosteroid isomerase-like protein
MPKQEPQTDDYDQVEDLVMTALRIIGSEDFEPYFDLFADDALWMLPSSTVDVDKAQARRFYSFTSKFRFDQRAEVDELVVSGDWAFVRLSFDGFLSARFDPDAVPIRSVSRHIWLLRKSAAGKWQITRDIWNNPVDVARTAIPGVTRS